MAEAGAGKRPTATPDAGLKGAAEQIAQEVAVLVERAAKSFVEARATVASGGTAAQSADIVEVALWDLVSQEARARAESEFARIVESASLRSSALASKLEPLLGITRQGVMRRLGGSR